MLSCAQCRQLLQSVPGDRVRRHPWRHRRRSARAFRPAEVLDHTEPARITAVGMILIAAPHERLAPDLLRTYALAMGCWMQPHFSQPEGACNLTFSR
jgi:hypothetical protein